jgi:hypothetical protein
MFWNFIRWGGTISIILLVLAAVFLGTQSEHPEQPTVTPVESGPVVPAEPAEAAPPPKNFNL